MLTAWNKIKVCNKCLSTMIKGEYSPYCAECGHTGIAIVLKRYNISFRGIKTEYKQYSNYVNPFEKTL